MLNNPSLTRLPTINPKYLDWIENAIYALVIMNGVDAILTITWVTFDMATEANPLMDGLLQTHPVLFMTTKLALVFLGLKLLWNHRKKRMVTIGIIILCLVYYGLMLVHALGVGIVISYWAL